MTDEPMPPLQEVVASVRSVAGAVPSQEFAVYVLQAAPA